MGPNEKDIVNITCIEQRLREVLVDKFVFEIVHVNVGIGRCHFRTHSCTFNLSVVLIVKLKMIMGQNELHDRDNILCRRFRAEFVQELFTSG